MKPYAFTALLKKEMVPALGCTGPTAYALAGACCRPYLTAAPKEIRLYVSPGFLKIGFGVATPGTSRPGIEVPAALGLIGGDWHLGLSVLKPCKPEDMDKALAMADSGIIRVLCAEDKGGVYVRCEVDTDNEQVVAVVERTHDGVSLIRVGDEIKFSRAAEGGEDEADMPDRFTLEEMFDYVDAVDPEALRFLLEGYRINLDLAEDGIRQGFGLQSGRAYLANWWRERGAPADLYDNPMKYLPDTAQARARVLVAGASDARMGGSRLPAMAAMGDGNQGLTAMIPVGVSAELLGKDEAQTIRALALSCLMLFYVKINIGRESSFCLCSIAAAAGVAAGVTYLRGMARPSICAAVKNVISPLCGMLCDGAKNACALKMAIASDTAFSGVELAAAGVECGFYDGVADDTLEHTVECITNLANESIDLLDRSMVQQIVRKTERRQRELNAR